MSPLRRRSRLTALSKCGWMTSYCNRGSSSRTAAGTRTSALSLPTSTKWSSLLACDLDGDAARGEERPPQLSLCPVAPAIQHQPVGQSAGERRAGVHLPEAQPAVDEHWSRAVGLRAVAELAARVRAPAIGETVSGDAAGVLSAGGDDAKGESARHGRRYQHERVAKS